MHDPYVTSLEIGRPPDLGGGQWAVSGLKPVSVVFGRNGSGKSRLLRLWRDTGPDDIHYIVPERAGTLEFEASYLQQELSGQNRRNQAQQNYLNEYRQRVVTRIQSYFTARGNVRGGILPGDPGDLEFLLQQLIPDFTIELDALAAPPYRLWRVSSNTRVTSINDLSSGEAQLLTLGLDVLTIAAVWDIEKREKRVILIDEPDAHIHPDLQVRFADFLVQVGTKYDLQLVVATHSTSLLAAIGQFAGVNAGVVYMDRSSLELTFQPLDKIRRELSSMLGGHVLMGPLFGVPILLVEGDDDYRIWSQVPRYHQVNLAVIPAGGDEIKLYQKALEQLLESITEVGTSPAGFALIDSDKPKPTVTTTPQVHIKYIQLSCHETENLYLSDEVLTALGTEWNLARAKIEAAAPNFGQKAGKLIEVAGGDRKSVDLKSVIQQLETILDARRVHWTLRVAKVIGTQRPSGQIAEFLGDEVVNALWGAPPNVSVVSTEGDP